MHLPSATVLIVVALVAIIFVPLMARQLISMIRITRGLRVERHERTHDMERIRAYHDGLPESERAHSLDERTWGDLDLDQVFVALDRTESQPGQQYLYHLLRTPRFDHAALDRFERVVACFAADVGLADRVRTELGRLGDARAALLHELVLNELPARPALWWLFPTLALAAVTCVALSAIWPPVLIGLLAICALNINIQTFYRRRVRSVIPAFHGVPALLRVARALGALHEAALDEWTTTLCEGADVFAVLRRATAWLAFEPDETNEAASSGYEYMNLFFLLDLNAFVFGIDTVRARREMLRRVLDTVGFLDAAQSVARWRSELPRWTVPELTNAAKALDVENAAHPILNAPVANSLTLHETSVLITGSNMSGKTTFVRTLGVNAILAQTIHTTYAARWRAPFLAVRTSIGRADSLAEGKSYYLSEVESVLALIRAKDDGHQHLFLLDELYRGTNTTERVAAARAVLAYLDRGQDIVVVATHDLELLEMLGSCYAPYHFREQIANGALEFDYLIRPGPSSTRNAIALLELMQYPEAVIADALRAVSFER